MTPLKSLAHPDWPYAGTAHEWRGFVEKPSSEEKLHGSAALYMHERNKHAIYQKQALGPELT